MRPLTVITGIILGSCVSILVGLAFVLLIYLLFHNDYPRLNAEIGSLLGSLGVFSFLTTISALSFYSLLIRHKWRTAALGLMWLGLAGTGFYYWPS